MIHFDLYLYCLDVVPVMVRVGNGLDWSGYPSDSASICIRNCLDVVPVTMRVGDGLDVSSYPPDSAS